ncbi:MAG: type I restriction enzyme HsdR N-terminal domain-containing protein [Simkaniaceae bacterium]|nr:type I restriction enzyme HsdR N-terminal domain-containing protein [Simkaniaceae bacterium]
MALLHQKPEEALRQALIGEMVMRLGFPKGSLVVEKALSALPQNVGRECPNRRVDILCYGVVEGDLLPLLVIECKAGKVGNAALEQVRGYNHFIGAPFMAVAGSNGVKTGYFEGDSLRLVEGLPSYEELLRCVK